MITDLPVLDAARLPAHDWAPGDPLPVHRTDLTRLRCAPEALAALAGALRTGGPRVRLDVTAGSWPDHVDVAALVAGGVVECEVETAAFAGAPDWVRFVATLVAAREHGLAPAWTATAGRPEWVRAEVLHHLAPPTATEDATTRDLRAWTAAHRFGSFYWRRGPGFVSVVDARDDEAVARYVIDEANLLALFTALECPVEVTALPVEWRGALEELDEACLVVRDGGLVARLPYRLRHRPMPGHRI